MAYWKCQAYGIVTGSGGMEGTRGSSRRREVRLFGGFRLQCGQVAATRLPRRGEQLVSLLAIAAAEERLPMVRRTAAALLYPGAKDPLENLRQTLDDLIGELSAAGRAGVSLLGVLLK